MYDDDVNGCDAHEFTCIALVSARFSLCSIKTGRPLFLAPRRLRELATEELSTARAGPLTTREFKIVCIVDDHMFHIT